MINRRIVILAITILMSVVGYAAARSLLRLERIPAGEWADPYQSLLPPPSPASRIPCKYRGDIQRYAEHSNVYPRLQPFAQHALLVLANADDFCGNYFGLGGVSDMGGAMRMLGIDPLADEAFKELVVNGTLVAKLYGLSGVYFTDPRWYREVVPRLAAEDSPVNTWPGCMPHERKASGVIRSGSEQPDIVRGYFPRQFLAEVYGEPAPKVQPNNTMNPTAGGRRPLAIRAGRSPAAGYGGR